LRVWTCRPRSAKENLTDAEKHEIRKLIAAIEAEDQRKAEN
jgi:hypothetical protein